MILWSKLSACHAGILAGILSLAACTRTPPLPLLGEVPQFQLVSQTGQPFDSRSLDGHIWVADFFYTTCTGPCPMMSSEMRRLQTETAGMSGVRLVSFTVDPAHDTPPVIAAYAKNFKQDPARWTLLTGEQPVLNDLGLHTFKLNSVDGSLGHSTRFVLIDRRRQIRGYYLFGEDDFRSSLLRDIRRLEREPS